MSEPTRKSSKSRSTRVAALRATGILDTPRERDFDEIVEYVARLLDVPICIVSLVDADRQWFKAERGMDLLETPLDLSICLHAIEEREFLEINDTTTDPRTMGNALCKGLGGLRFYAGAVLRLEDDVPIGALAVLDSKPRELTQEQREAMILLARQVVRQIELREALAVQDRLRGEIDHRVKNSLQMVASYLRLQRRTAGAEAQDVLSQAEQQVAAIVALHAALSESAHGAALDIKDYAERIVSLLAHTLPGNIRLKHEVEPAIIGAEQASAVGLIINEAVANSVKHAFPEGDNGSVRLDGRFVGEDYELKIADDGVGFEDAASGNSSGLTIIAAAAQQLGATLSRPSGERGATLRLVFPAGRLETDRIGVRQAS